MWEVMECVGIKGEEPGSVGWYQRTESCGRMKSGDFSRKSTEPVLPFGFLGLSAEQFAVSHNGYCW